MYGAELPFGSATRLFWGGQVCGRGSRLGVERCQHWASTGLDAIAAVAPSKHSQMQTRRPSDRHCDRSGQP
ncbi:hypothetical protein IQ273_11770 [Nodosilinea sp. LEGE 07298]|uniref:hypothetical protein n=1 Tax=Nodosilinea sp. LEGE 07298 TaxID=2777970 RepID=UPI00188252FD|nr:hypothetical protein [Nodosilinea sp. LEGE 07298]MBE9110087.1 hypothetical protein [Nodosilinea sp. LEGE 07298]